MGEEIVTLVRSVGRSGCFIVHHENILLQWINVCFNYCRKQVSTEWGRGNDSDSNLTGTPEQAQPLAE
jgi:hypothetical protein